jgi:hypothetical protein
MNSARAAPASPLCSSSQSAYTNRGRSSFGAAKIASNNPRSSAVMTHPPTTPAPSYRRGVALSVLVVAAGGLVGTRFPPHVVGNGDFVEYAAAARLLLAGQNPYDARLLLPVQKAAGWGTGQPPDEPLRADMMWNPPWALPIVMPLGLVGFGPGLGAWVMLQAVAVAWASAWAWRASGGLARLTAAAVGLGFVFAPTVLVLRVAQIGGLIAFGLGGFAAGMRAGRPGLAGAAAALTALKPHLFVPFAVLLACDALASRATRKAVGVGAAVLAVLAVVPTAWTPGVWGQYLEAVKAPSDEFHVAPGDWAPPALSYRLAAALGGGLGAQFVPSAAATAVLVAYWWTRRRAWDWPRELPAVVLVGVLSTGYGAWGFDLVVLLPAVMQAATWAAGRYALWAYLGANAVALTFVVPVAWWGPMVAAGYVLAVLVGRKA